MGPNNLHLSFQILLLRALLFENHDTDPRVLRDSLGGNHVGRNMKGRAEILFQGLSGLTKLTLSESHSIIYVEVS